MSSMFLSAASFNGDLSQWDVSTVTNMNNMFQHATSFKQKLCGVAWLHSKANNIDIFAGSHGSISPKVCENCLAGMAPTLSITTARPHAATSPTNPQ